MKTKVAYLASGQGANLALSLAFAKSPQANFEVVLVLADKECGAVEIAKHEGIPFRVMDAQHLFHAAKEELENVGADLVITTIHKILPPWLLEQFTIKFVNLHYSLLPNLAGTIGNKTLKLSFEQNSLFSGATVHLVSEELDAGAQLAQVVIPKTYFSSFETFAAAVTLTGGLALVATISNWQAHGTLQPSFPLHGLTSNLRVPILSSVELPQVTQNVLSDFLSIYGKNSLWPEMVN